MKIRQTSINLVYPKIVDWRKKFVIAEDVLSGFFMPAIILPIPDQVQEQVPRAIAQSMHGHSVLNVALTVSSFATTYSGSYVDSWKLCEKYLTERCDSIYRLIDKLSDNNHEYVGLVTNIEFDDIDDLSVEVLKRSLLRNSGIDLGKMFDIYCKFTYVYKNVYYINIALENTHELLSQEKTDRGVTKTDVSQNYVAVTIDINDRYAAGNNCNYKSSKTALEEILKITGDIIEGRLEKLIQEGAFTYVGE